MYMKICLLGDVLDIITCAKFQNDIFVGYDFTGVEFSIFLLILEWVYNRAALLRCLWLARPASRITMPPASLCFTDVTFFLMSFVSFNNGWTDRNAHCCVNNTVDGKNY